MSDTGPGRNPQFSSQARTNAGHTITGYPFLQGPRKTPAPTQEIFGSSTGTLLATAAFANETASGSLQVNFSSAVPHHPRYDVRRLISHDMGSIRPMPAISRRCSDERALNRAFFLLLAVTVSTLYGTASKLPNSNFNAMNYWVDVVFNSS